MCLVNKVSKGIEWAWYLCHNVTVSLSGKLDPGP